LENFGHWQADVYNRNQIEVQKNFDMDRVNLAYLEHAIGQASMQKTTAWCEENWSKLPQLMMYRGLSHWGFFNTSVPIVLQIANIWLIVVGLVGCCLCTGRLRLLFVSIILLDMLLVMLTWEHLGRYAIPIRPIVHLGYGVAVSKVLHWLWEAYAAKKVGVQA
jgi:hypothetical protein